MGKTICLSAIGRELGGKQLILQHRQELVAQNMAKYRLINPTTRVSTYTADSKSMRGDAVFAMAQTLTRNLDRIPHFDLAILDEAHHAAAPTWKNIIAAAKEKNPGLCVVGVTATPERSDRRSLRGLFDTVSDHVTIRELVQLGYLVRPRAYVVDVSGTQERLRALGNTSDFGDQVEVEKILNTTAVNEEVVRHWRERCADRQTIIFGATVQHAQDVAAAFAAAGVRSACVHGAMKDAERKAILRRFDAGEIQVLTNVMVLTEGFDSQPVASVILLRKCSEKGPLIQMVGRGLRTVSPEKYPGVIKKDCVVLDFGTSLLTHGDLDMAAALKEEKEFEPGEAATKFCPGEDSETYRVPDATGRKGCGAELPAQTKTCPLCGFVFERLGAEDGSEVVEVELTEMEILEASPFRYVDLFETGRAMIAKGFAAWAGIFSPDGETWFALGKIKDERKIHQIAISERLQAMAAADDFLRTYETDGGAKKTKRWLDQPASEKQLGLLSRLGYQIHADLLGSSPFTKYSAVCHAEFQFCRVMIERAIGVAA